MSGLVKLRFHAECRVPGCGWKFEGARADLRAAEHTRKAGHPATAASTPVPATTGEKP